MANVAGAGVLVVHCVSLSVTLAKEGRTAPIADHLGNGVSSFNVRRSKKIEDTMGGTTVGSSGILEHHVFCGDVEGRREHTIALEHISHVIVVGGDQGLARRHWDSGVLEVELSAISSA